MAEVAASDGFYPSGNDSSSGPETGFLRMCKRLPTSRTCPIRGPGVRFKGLFFPVDAHMLTIPSLLAAMTIAGAFWVGVLAARRLRDWGDGRRVLEEGDAPLALSAASGAAADEGASRRVRAAVAERLAASVGRGRVVPIVERRAEELGFETLRTGDVVTIETPENRFDGDYVVEGLVRMREGATTTVLAVIADGGTTRWLVGSDARDEHLVLDPVEGHGLTGEPPRNLQRGERLYALVRRGQASAAAVGRHHRPEGARVGTYTYQSGQHEVLWLERWGAEISMGEGVAVPAHAIGFLPGS